MDSPDEIIEWFEDNITHIGEPEEATKKAKEYIKDQGFEFSITASTDVADNVWTHPKVENHNGKQKTIMTSLFFDLYKWEYGEDKVKMIFTIGRLGNTTNYTKTFEEEA